MPAQKGTHGLLVDASCPQLTLQLVSHCAQGEIDFLDAGGEALIYRLGNVLGLRFGFPFMLLPTVVQRHAGNDKNQCVRTHKNGEQQRAQAEVFFMALGI
ncbi:MAG: hypothetical protein RBS05_10185 [Zoogloea oleivorans]|uniref:Uncharacterized protein n=1 Tax=Zoogloea oleivorans TaxID=1552750 RepID=A0A6C2CM03_9RHOO|nr:hypothetical protein [Zoogloea oleivorans]MDY0036265.1 hypothetical protein [Zoogloea oleivorans]TYC55224.1 hypothetical protein ETQ85_14500 [Zoogloea oleivorans]